MNPLIQTWIDKANKNPWTRVAWDPPVTENNFFECKTVQELWDKLNHGNWCLGQPFYIGNICLMNQVNGGWGEWLVIRGKVSFESISFNPIHTPISWWEKFIADVGSATDDELKNLEYRKS